MKIMVLILLILFMSGCTIYEVKRTMSDGSTLEVLVKSNRQIDQPNLHYARADDSAEFDFSATGLTPTASPIEQAIASGIVAGTLVLSPIPKKETE